MTTDVALFCCPLNDIQANERFETPVRDFGYDSENMIQNRRLDCPSKHIGRQCPNSNSAFRKRPQ